MQVYHNMSNQRFIAELRDAAIVSRLPPLFIDAVDRLAEIVDQEEHIEELQMKIEDLKNELADRDGQSVAD